MRVGSGRVVRTLRRFEKVTLRASFAMFARRCASVRASLVAAKRAARRNARGGGVRSSRAGRRASSSTRTLSASASSSSSSSSVAASDDDAPEYVRRASTPSAFEETSWGDDSDLAETCLRAMRIQWTHGFASTPKGFARATHGFGEILAGMQPAACEAIFAAFDAPVRSVMDPFMGGGTTLIVAQGLGCRAVGVDVSPLACFVSANRNWRASTRAAESLRTSARSAMADARGRDDGDDGGGDGDGGDAVPRAWRRVRNALAAHAESARFASEVDQAHRDRVVEALWFCLSVAIQRTQKSQNKRRGRRGGKRRNGDGGGGGDENVEAFLKIVDEYVDRVREFQAACESAPNVAPPAEIYNVDVRKFKLGDDEKVDAVLTSCPYPAVYDYLSFARKVRAGSGAVVKKSTSSASSSAREATSAYVDVVVPGDRNWPKTWMEGEIGSRKALRSNPYEFAAVWQREQEDWLAVVADSLRPGGRAAIMVGDGANIDTRKSIVAAATKSGLLELGGATMKLTATMADGQTVYNQARTEHLIVFRKP